MERGRGSAFGSFFLSSSHFGRGGLMEKKLGLSFCAPSPPRVKAREGKKKVGNAVDRRHSTATAALLLLSPLLFLFPATRGELFSPFLVRRCLFIDRLPLFWRAEGESKSAERDNQRRQSPLSLSTRRGGSRRPLALFFCCFFFFTIRSRKTLRRTTSNRSLLLERA